MPANFCISNAPRGSSWQIRGDPRREAIFLVADDKAGNWDGWYREAIPLADERFTQHLTELVAEESRKR